MTEESEMADRWLSVDQIADYLGVSRDTVYNWISDRDIPGRKVGRFWKFKKDAVDAWVESGGSDMAEDSPVRTAGHGKEESGT